MGLLLRNSFSKKAVFLGEINASADIYIDSFRLSTFKTVSTIYYGILSIQDIVHLCDKIREIIKDGAFSDIAFDFEDRADEYIIIAVSPTHINYIGLKRKYNL